jgi:hypothetical protein
VAGDDLKSLKWTLQRMLEAAERPVLELPNDDGKPELLKAMDKHLGELAKATAEIDAIAEKHGLKDPPVKEVFLRCECSGYHFVEIYRDPDWDNATFITHIEQPRTFTEKLKAIWGVMRGRTVFDSELLIKDVDLARVAKLLLRRKGELE